MRFRLLGPVEIDIAGRSLSLPRRRERCLLGLLLLQPGQAMTVDRLADLLWDGDPPGGARRAIHSHVSRLRAVLARSGGTGAELSSTGNGYRIRVEPLQVDAHRFQALLDQSARSGDPERRADLLREAVGLWRGPLLDNAASDWLRERVGADLAEQRFAATESLLSTSLALGREREVLPEVARLAAAHPGRESLAALHMRALYQADRRVEALAVYEHTRSYLADQLGLDPSPSLRRLHQAVLRDALVTPARTARSTGAAQAFKPRQLPPDLPGFAGRDGELARLDALLPAQGCPTDLRVAIIGTAGVGKTTMAIRWAHRVADRFPDGQLYLDLHGFDAGQPPMTPSAAVRALLEGLRVPPSQLPGTLPAQVGLFRSLLAERAVLVVLDNAVSDEQVRPLLPGTAGSLVIVTSRNQLPQLVAAEGAHPLRLDVLPAGEARELLERRLGPARTAAEPAAVDRLVERCAGLPLALAMVAARAATHPGFPLASIVDDLAGTDGLAWLADPATASDVRAVLSWSYRALEAEAAGMFRLLGLHPGPECSVAAAASLAGVPLARARALLAELARASLITEHSPGRYRFHDLLRGYAAELAHSEESGAAREQASRRMLDHYLHTAHRAARAYEPLRPASSLTVADPVPGVTATDIEGREQALAWLGTERRVLLAAVRHASDRGLHLAACQLTWLAVEYLFHQGHWHDQVTVFGHALRSAEQLADPTWLARCHRGLGDAHAALGGYEQARTHYQHALGLCDASADQLGLAATHMNLAWLADRRGDYAGMLHHGQRAHQLATHADNRSLQARALGSIGWAYLCLGDITAGVACSEQALALHEQQGYVLGCATTLDSLGYAHHQRGDHEQAIDCYLRALALFDRKDNCHHRAETLSHLGEAYVAVGEVDAARETWLRALKLLDELGEPEAAQLRTRLDQLIGG